MSKHTAEQVEACILAYRNGDLNYCRAGIIGLLTAYAATLRQAPAQGGVTEAMVEHAALALYLRDGGTESVWKADRHFILRDAYRSEARIALEATLSAEPAAQGEAVGVVTTDFNAHAATGVRWLPGVVPAEGTKLYTAPPAQPAERVPEVPKDWIPENLNRCCTELTKLINLQDDYDFDEMTVATFQTAIECIRVCEAAASPAAPAEEGDGKEGSRG